MCISTCTITYMVQLKCNIAKLACNSLVTYTRTHCLECRTHCLECRVQIVFKNFTVNTTLHLSYDGYLCKEILFQLKATFYKALYCNNNLQTYPLVFLYMGAYIMLVLWYNNA